MRVARSLTVVAFGLMALGAATPAAADMFGVRAGFYTKAEEPFVGAELLIPLSHNVFLTRGSTFVWAGAGLAVLYSNPDGPGDSSNDVGANFIFGVGRRGPVVPYIQAKLIAKDDTEFVISLGLRSLGAGRSSVGGGFECAETSTEPPSPARRTTEARRGGPEGSPPRVLT